MSNAKVGILIKCYGCGVAACSMCACYDCDSEQEAIKAFIEMHGTEALNKLMVKRLNEKHDERKVFPSVS